MATPRASLIFSGDQPLDEKLFSMEIPEGYKIEDMGGITVDQLKAPPTTQEAAKLILKPGVGIGDLKAGEDTERRHRRPRQAGSHQQQYRLGLPLQGPLDRRVAQTRRLLHHGRLQKVFSRL